MFRLFDARLDIDLRCNYRCPFCWSLQGNHKSMDLATVESSLSVLKKYCWHIYLSCSGEPLLHKDFNKIMHYVGDNLNQTDTTIITNGWKLTSEYSHAICNAGITTVIISIHSLDAAIFRKLTGIESNNGLDEVNSNIESLIKTRGNRNYPKIIINTVVMKSTINGLHDIAKWICNSDINGLRLLWFQPQDDIFSQEEYLKPSKATDKIVADLNNILRSHGKFFDAPYLSIINRCKSVLSGLNYTKRPIEFLYHSFRKFVNTILNKRCKIAGLSLFVSQTGDISVCPNGLKMIGTVTQLQTENVNKKVFSMIRDNNDDTCKQCGIDVSMKIQKDSA